MASSILLAALLAALQPTGSPATCQAALGSVYDEDTEAALPNPVDGATLRNRDALVLLRQARGDALITVRGGNFARADFRRDRLRNICFIETDLSGSNWRGADAAGIGFVRANLAGANLSEARMAGALFRQSNLENVDATGADLSGGKLDGGWDGSAENLRLIGANLTGFRFDCGITISDGCPIDGAIDVSRADLTGAVLNGYDRFTNWTGARIDRTEVALEQLASLTAADLAGPIRVRGGETVAELSAAEHRTLLPHLGLAGEARTPSFDCARAAAGVEQLLCGAEGGRLRRLDRDVAWLYRRARGRGLAAEQAAWLAERNRCAPAPEEGAAAQCLERAYEVRKQALVARLGANGELRPGRTTLYVAPPVAIDEAFHGNPLYQRLVPVIIDASWSRVAVRANADGTIDAVGTAIGGNAHSCTLGGRRLRFDRRTGFYGGPHEDQSDVPEGWRGLPMPVLLLWGDRAEVYGHGRSGYGAEEGDPRMSDYASCGARAGFSEMIRMPISNAAAAQWFADFSEP